MMKRKTIAGLLGKTLPAFLFAACAYQTHAMQVELMQTHMPPYGVRDAHEVTLADIQQNRLFDATYAADLGTFAQQLAVGANVNKRDERDAYCATPLDRMICVGNLPAVCMLLAAGATPNDPVLDGYRTELRVERLAPAQAEIARRVGERREALAAYVGTFLRDPEEPVAPAPAVVYPLDLHRGHPDVRAMARLVSRARVCKLSGEPLCLRCEYEYFRTVGNHVARAALSGFDPTIATRGHAQGCVYRPQGMARLAGPLTMTLAQ